MISENVKYVEQMPGGGYRIAGSRVGLECIVVAYLDGQSAETIRDNFPSLSLEAIHGAIAMYLRNREEFNDYMAQLSVRYEELKQESDKRNATLLTRLRAARRDIPIN